MAKGDCYEVAGREAMNWGTPMAEYVGEPHVVHATVQGQGSLEGIRYGHAWIEDDVFVYDYSNDRQIQLPKIVYYALGNVREQEPEYYRYTFEEARDKMLETGHFGSWDLESEY